MGLIENYIEKRKKILAMASPEAIEKRHSKGQWTARERLDYLFDEGTFTEIGLYVKHRTTAFGLDKKVIPAEGVVTGYGKVNGRYVVAFAEDRTVTARCRQSIRVASSGAFSSHSATSEPPSLGSCAAMGAPAAIVSRTASAATKTSRAICSPSFGVAIASVSGSPGRGPDGPAARPAMAATTRHNPLYMAISFHVRRRLPYISGLRSNGS